MICGNCWRAVHRPNWENAAISTPEAFTPAAQAPGISEPAPPGNGLSSRLSASFGEPTPLSPRLCALVAQVEQDCKRLTRRIFDQMLREIPSYARAAGTGLHPDVLEMLQRQLQGWYTALLTATLPVSPERAIMVAEVARRRMHQGIPMGDLMHAYRLGMREFWKDLVGAAGDDAELQQELLQKVSINLMASVDADARSVLETYLAEERRQVRSRDRLRRELSHLLFSRPTDLVGFRELGAALGLNIDAPAGALAFRLRDPNDVMLNIEESLDRIAGQIAGALGVSSDSFLRALRGDLLLIWRPASPDDPAFEYARQLEAQAKAILRATPDLAAVGIGLPGAGPQGWRVAAEQATRALEMQAEQPLTTNSPEPVSCYSQMILVEGATATENARHYFESITDRLSLEPNLLETLQTYFEFKQRRKRVAAELNVHPNSLDYRLARIETLLDLSLDDVTWLARLQVALQWWARRRRGAPAG
jgi:carbohydrate diacid regulator